MNKTKRFIKTAVIALTIMLAFAISFALTGAWYLATRSATGTITLNDGIVIDYSGFGEGSGVWENNATFLLFSSQENIMPGTTIALNDSKIKANSSSASFFGRVKFSYKFFTDKNGDNEVTNQIADYSAFVNTPSFASGWVDGNTGDGYYYYATGTTFNALPTNDYVDIFVANSTITLDGNAPGFDHEGGGYQYSNEILIKRIEVYLVFEAYQADATAAANAGWGIYVPPQVVENSNSQVVEILQNTITLGDVGGAYKLGTGEAGSLEYNTSTLGNTLKIIVAGNSQINANAFDGSDLENIYIGDAEYINAVSSYSAKIYTTPAIFKIGSNAFSGCSSLNLYLSSNCNYEIYANSLSGVGNIYLDGVLTNDLKEPSVGQYNGYIIVLSNLNIVTGGSGAGTINITQPANYRGQYTYEDANGNIWYFDLINNNTQVKIRFCDMADKSTENQSISIPKVVSSGELLNINVVELVRSYTSTSGDHGSIFNHGELLTSITIPNSVQIIGYQAFAYCPISSIIIPNSVTNISDAAFWLCERLTNITIPSSVTDISNNAFDSCIGLTSFSGGNEKYTISSDGRCLIEHIYGQHCLVAFAPSGLTSYTIPNSITTLDLWGGFVSITSITIPNSVYTINNGIFCWSANLETVTFEGGGDRNTFSIGYGAFANDENLTTVNFNGDWTGIVVSVAEDAFANCPKLTNLQIPN
ncbi:MAG: leucine-rich repeat protein [Clostridia bacterium]|nr:leucine-rich repeat protein [Clostridia bacterium]